MKRVIFILSCINKKLKIFSLMNCYVESSVNHRLFGNSFILKSLSLFFFVFTHPLYFKTFPKPWLWNRKLFQFLTSLKQSPKCFRFLVFRSGSPIWGQVARSQIDKSSCSEKAEVSASIAVMHFDRFTNMCTLAKVVNRPRPMACFHMAGTNW